MSKRMFPIPSFSACLRCYNYCFFLLVFSSFLLSDGEILDLNECDTEWMDDQICDEPTYLWGRTFSVMCPLSFMVVLNKLYLYAVAISTDHHSWMRPFSLYFSVVCPCPPALLHYLTTAESSFKPKPYISTPRWIKYIYHFHFRLCTTTTNNDRNGLFFHFSSI